MLATLPISIKYFQILVKKSSLDFLVLLHQGKRTNLKKIVFDQKSNPHFLAKNQIN